MVETGASFADELLALGSDDVVVVMAYGRLQSHVSVLLDHADTMRCPVVLITDSLARTLGGRVASLLQCGRGASGLFSSHAGTVLLIEALVLAVAKGHEARARNRRSSRSTNSARRLRRHGSTRADRLKARDRPEEASTPGVGSLATLCRGSLSRPIVGVGAVRMLAGFEMRRRGRRVVLLTLLVGVVGAVVLSRRCGRSPFGVRAHAVQYVQPSWRSSS